MWQLRQSSWQRRSSLGVTASVATSKLAGSPRSDYVGAHASRSSPRARTAATSDASDANNGISPSRRRNSSRFWVIRSQSRFRHTQKLWRTRRSRRRLPCIEHCATAIAFFCGGRRQHRNSVCSCCPCVWRTRAQPLLRVHPRWQLGLSLDSITDGCLLASHRTPPSHATASTALEVGQRQA